MKKKRKNDKTEIITPYYTFTTKEDVEQLERLVITQKLETMEKDIDMIKRDIESLWKELYRHEH